MTRYREWYPNLSVITRVCESSAGTNVVMIYVRISTCGLVSCETVTLQKTKVARHDIDRFDCGQLLIFTFSLYHCCFYITNKPFARQHYSVQKVKHVMMMSDVSPLLVFNANAYNSW